MATQIKKILIANRGEIAVRVIRACRDLGITSVAVFSEADQSAFHARMADQAIAIGPAPSSQSYLVHDRIIDAAKLTGADAIHPGYGFLSENAVFAQRCKDEGIIFIGPEPDTISQLGDKLVARAMAIKAGLPVVPGENLADLDPKSAKAAAKKIGYPVMVKAAAGGGGKGMRVVSSEDELEEAMDRAANEAQSAFGDSRVFMEKYLTRPRHIEIQILCDTHGNALYLGERECSIQRRHQKVIEESPSPVVTTEIRKKMGEAAVNIAKASGYVGAGTVEFIYQDGEFYFLEVNTRLQVEHPVTEMVTGLDLVQEQIWIAEGKAIGFKQDDVRMHGHALECRIYAEDPDEGFIPSTGQLKNYRMPAGPGVRVDAGVVIFEKIPIYYDPMIAKLVTWGQDREQATRRMLRALDEFRISGVRTTIGFHQVVLRNSKFVAGDLSTRFLEEEYPDNTYHALSEADSRKAAIAAAIDKFVAERRIALAVGGDNGRTSNWVRTHRRTNLRTFGGSK